MRNLIIFFCLLFYISCQNSVNDKNDNIVHTDTIGVPKIDSICKLQLGEYINSASGLNAEKSIELTYSGVFAYLEKQYPDEYSIDRIKQMMIERIVDLKLKIDKKKIRQEFIIEDIVKRISYNGTFIYLIKTTSILKKNNKIIDEFSDETIGISKDEGNTWRYLGKDTIMSPQILSLDFPSQVVNEVFVLKN